VSSSFRGQRNRHPAEFFPRARTVGKTAMRRARGKLLDTYQCPMRSFSDLRGSPSGKRERRATRRPAASRAGAGELIGGSCPLRRLDARAAVLLGERLLRDTDRRAWRARSK